MADYTVHFAVHLDNLTKKQLEFWKEAQSFLARYEESEDADVELGAIAEATYGAETRRHLDLSGSTGVCILVRESSEPLKVLLTNDPDEGAHELAAELIRAFLYEFQISAPVLFTYACTCSAPKPDGFGGGYVIVHDDEVQIVDALDSGRERLDESPTRIDTRIFNTLT